MFHHLKRPHAQTQTRLSRLARSLSGPRITTRLSHRLTLERCESRIAPATATLVSGVLTIDFTATGTTTENVTVTNDGTNISLTGNVTGAKVNPVGDVSRIVVQDTSAGTAQSVTFAGSAAYSLADGLQIDGVEFATVNVAVSTANLAPISISATKSVTVSANLATIDGAISLSGNWQAIANVGAFSGVLVQNKAVISSTSGAITLRGHEGDSLNYGGVAINESTVGLGTTGPVTVEGYGGSGLNTKALLTSGGGDVSMTDLADGVDIFFSSTITAGGLGKVAVHGEGTYVGVNLWSVSKITSSGGTVSVKGRGGASTKSDCFGVALQLSGNEISAGGMGGVTVEGTGGMSVRNANYGVFLASSGDRISSAGGPVVISGFGGGVGASSDNIGVYARFGNSTPAFSASGTGSLSIFGKGGSTTGNGNVGVSLSSASAVTVDGPLSIIGEGGGIGASGENNGVYIAGGTSVRANGLGNITVTATGGATGGNNNEGLYNWGSIISNNGAIAVMAQGGGASASSGNIGINNNISSSIRAEGKGSVDVRAYGGVTSGTGNYGLYQGFINSVDGLTSVTARSGSNDVEAIRQASVWTTGVGNIVMIADSIYSPNYTAGGKSDAVLTIRPLTPGVKIDIGGSNVLGGTSPTLGLPTSFGGSAGTLQIGDAATGPITVSANVSRNTNSKLVITTGSSTTLAASVVFSSGSITLNSVGPVVQTAGTIQASKGTLTLNAPNQTATFNSLGNKAAQLVIPATVTAIVNGSFDSTGFVQVDGTLGGTGSVGVTTVSSTGRVKPGSGGVGKLTTGNIAFNAGSVLETRLSGASYGQLAVNGTVNLGGATLQATATGPNVGQPYRIIDNLGSGAVTGTFAGLSESATYTTGAYQYRVSYQGGTGNDVTLTPPAVVSSVVFGDGTNERSLVKQLVVNFSQPVNFTADAFLLSRSGTGGTIGDVSLNLNPAGGPTSAVTITFTGALSEFGSLVDGFYNFAIDATKITSTGGNLDGDANGTGGDSFTVVGTTANKFFRLFGDTEGDGTVGLDDFSAFRSAFNQPSTIFDFNNDGIAGLADFARFRAGYGTSP